MSTPAPAWVERARSDWSNWQAAQQDALEQASAQQQERLAERLQRMGVEPEGRTVVLATENGTPDVWVELVRGRRTGEVDDDGEEVQLRAVWARVVRGGYDLHVGDIAGRPYAPDNPVGRQHLVDAGELGTLADIGRVLEGPPAEPEPAEESTAQLLERVLRALVDDAVADAIEGRL